MTYLTYPESPLTAVFFTANTSSPATFSKLFTEFSRIHPHLSDSGFAGYAAADISGGLRFAYIVPNVSQAQVDKAIDPFFYFAQSLTEEGLNIELALTAPFNSFSSWYKFIFSSPETQVGQNLEIASRLITREHIENNLEKVIDALLLMEGFMWQLVHD